MTGEGLVGEFGEERFCVLEFGLDSFSQMIEATLSEPESVQCVFVDLRNLAVIARSEFQFPTQDVGHVDQADESLVLLGFRGLVMMEDNAEVILRKLPLGGQLGSDVRVSHAQVGLFGVEQGSAVPAYVLEYGAVVIGEVPVEHDFA